MDHEVRFRDAPNVPRLGDPRKVPGYAYPNWGLPLGGWIVESDELYTSEWEGGSPRQMQYVVEAITMSGFGNFSQMLRDANSRKVAEILRKSERKLNYLEPGAGVSTVNLYSNLIKNNLDIEQLEGTLIEPSKERLESACTELEKLGLKRGKNFNAYVGRDLDVLDEIDPRSQDIISCVAQIHHHAYLDRPLSILHSALSPGGSIIIADWHNSMWEHPGRVLEALEEDYEWPSKETDLAAFREAYPMSLEKPPEVTGYDREANRMIREFWKSYGKVRADAVKRGGFEERDDILMLEGHRPVGRQIDEMKAVGFEIEYREQLLPDSSLLMVTVGRKT